MLPNTGAGTDVDVEIGCEGTPLPPVLVANTALVEVLVLLTPTDPVDPPELDAPVDPVVPEFCAPDEEGEPIVFGELPLLVLLLAVFGAPGPLTAVPMLPADDVGRARLEALISVGSISSLATLANGSASAGI